MVSTAVKDVSLANANGVFAVPELKALRSYRVVVCTCISAGALYGLGIEQGWFTHIFIDEAGQCTEPEIMVAIKTLAGANTNIVLAGDMQQLGPGVRSPLARELGLKMSYLQRLTTMPIYDLKMYKGITCVRRSYFICCPLTYGAES